MCDDRRSSSLLPNASSTRAHDDVGAQKISCPRLSSLCYTALSFSPMGGEEGPPWVRSQLAFLRAVVVADSLEGSGFREHPRPELSSAAQQIYPPNGLPRPHSDIHRLMLVCRSTPRQYTQGID